MRLLSALTIIALAVSSASADTDELLKGLVSSSPDVAAAKAQAEAARAELWEARGARLPQIRLEATAGTLEETLRINGVPGELTGTRDPASAQAVIEQAIFTSGRIGGSIGAAKAEASRAGHSFQGVRQDIILTGAIAIADLVRDRAILRERQTNESVVQGRLDESQARRRAGLATDTDVRQSEARLAQARAERIASEGSLARSQAVFTRVFGVAPTADLTLPRAPLPMPNTLDEALVLAFDENPDLAASEDRQRSAMQAVRAERGGLLPQVSVNATAAYIENERFGVELGEAEQYAVTLNGRWDVFRGGSGYARTRAAKKQASAAKAMTQAMRRRVRENTITAWADLQTRRASILAREAQASAALIASQGVDAEFRSGRRTRLDVLDADQEQTNAEVALLSARRDLAIAQFALLRAIGQL